MNNEIYADELKVAGKKIIRYQKYRNSLSNKSYTDYTEKPRSFEKYVIFSDGTTIEDILVPVLNRYETKQVFFVDAFPDVVYNEPLRDDPEGSGCVISFEEMVQTDYMNTAFILLIDSKKAHEKWFEILDKTAALTEQNVGNYILASVLVPPIATLPARVKALAEREYNYFMEKSSEPKTSAEKFTIDFEKACREKVRNGMERISILRFDNLLGSRGSNFAAIDIDQLMKDAFERKEVMIGKEDRLFCFSFMYTRDAAIAVASAANCAKRGHVYNVTEYSVSVAGLKSILQQLFPEEIALKTDGQTYSASEISYHNLSSLKFNHDLVKIRDRYQNLEDCIYYILCSRFDREFDAVSRLSVYQGKLDRLKETEIEILREIDRICRMHNIKYFLAGGSCLGAIRDGKSIPWDDDLDIGMLREDFEVFRRVAPRELDSGRFIYSSPQTDKNCHYYFDKIRLRDTYFSTMYSGKFVMDDGVFVDIVVYDNTTSNQLLQKAQIKLITYAIDAIYIRWHDHPVKRRKRISKYLLPVMRKIPFDKYHDVYDMVTTIFEKKQDVKYLLDGGAHLKNGGFEKSTLDGGVDYVTYDGMENVPIPSNYPGYLEFLYGENFRPEPSISSRLGAHKIARLDLGKYLEENDPEKTFRSVDIRGELFESEEET